VERDGGCRVWHVKAEWDVVSKWGLYGACAGQPEWAHLRGHRRSQTRGMSPEARHTTKHSLMLCTRHHRQEESGRLRITYLSERGCDGPLRFEVKA
jgi:hypothetical protein